MLSYLLKVTRHLRGKDQSQAFRHSSKAVNSQNVIRVSQRTPLTSLSNYLGLLSLIFPSINSHFPSELSSGSLPQPQMSQIPL